MKIKNTLIYFLLFGLGGSLFFFSLNKKVEAVPVSPDKYYLEVESGKTIQETLRIMIRTEEQGEVQGRKWYVFPVGMKKEGEFAAREFYMPDENDEREPANWISLEKNEFVTEPGTDLYIDWEMTPGELAGCGTNVAAIMVSTSPKEKFGDTESDDETAVIFNTQIVSQIHLDVLSTPEGECPRDGKTDLIDFKIERDEVNNPDDDKPKGLKMFGNIFFNYDEVPFITRIKNSGDYIIEKPKGYIEIAKDVDNADDEDKIILDVNEAELDIYPDTIQRFDNEWVDDDYPHDGGFFKKFWYEVRNFKFGKYEARLGLTKNMNPQVVAKEYFWIFPWRVIVVILAIIVFLMITPVMIYRQTRKKGKK